MNDSEKLLDLIEKLDKSSVLCVGDVMLDKFVYGAVSRISPEAPVPVCRVASETEMLGGAGNEARNLADNSVYQAEKMVSEHGEKVSEDIKTEIETKIAELKAVLANETSDSQTLRSSAEDLAHSLQKIGEAMYSQSAEDPIETDPVNDNEGADDEGTVDGEYREV